MYGNSAKSFKDWQILHKEKNRLDYRAHTLHSLKSVVMLCLVLYLPHFESERRKVEMVFPLTTFVISSNLCKQK